MHAANVSHTRYPGTRVPHVYRLSADNLFYLKHLKVIPSLVVGQIPIVLTLPFNLAINSFGNHFSLMSSPAFQNSAQELHAKLEGSARWVLDEVDKTMLRTIAHSSSKCVVACFDKAGKTGSSEELDHCSRKCQIPYQQATNLVQNVSLNLITSSQSLSTRF